MQARQPSATEALGRLRDLGYVEFREPLESDKPLLPGRTRRGVASGGSLIPTSASGSGMSCRTGAGGRRAGRGGRDGHRARPRCLHRAGLRRLLPSMAVAVRVFGCHPLAARDGSWWSRKGDVEVAIVGMRQQRYTLLAECKWSKNPGRREPRPAPRTTSCPGRTGCSGALGVARAFGLHRRPEGTGDRGACPAGDGGSPVR